MKKILFVCTGNTCRSSMAEGMLKKMLLDLGEKTKGIQVISAGTSAIKGQGASKGAVEVMNEKGIDLSDHDSTPLSKELIEEADLILTMTKRHKEQVLKICPQGKEKVYTLKEYTNKEGDILDPFGQATCIYRECAGEIEELLKILIETILGKN